MEKQIDLREAFRGSLLQTSIVDEFTDQFKVGADPGTLSPEARAIYEQAREGFKRRAQEDKVAPTCGELFKRTYESLTPTLDVMGSTKEEAGGHFLTQAQKQFFSSYGVLPAIKLDAVESDLITSVDRLCAALVKHPAGGKNGLGSNAMWVFDRDLLSLVTHPDIVEKVASLLGDELTFLGSDGPMFLPPNSPLNTAWHAFDADHFGGGGAGSNLQLVSVWIALADANVANGCMKIAPGSFRAFDALNKVAPKFYGSNTKQVIDELQHGPSKVDPEIASQIICRRLNDVNFSALLRLGTTASMPEEYRYNPFHSAVDRTWCIGPEQLSLIDEYPKVALEAKRGEAFFFVSQNAHASFMNTTNGWRKAIAFRYVKTAEARKSDITHSSQRLRTALDIFPGAAEVLRAVNRPLENFEEAAPRLCVRGRIPAGQEQFYFDAQQLHAALERMGGSCVTRIDPLPTAA